MYASPNIVEVIKSRRMSWVGHAARVKQMRNSYKIQVGKPEGKTAFGRPMFIWEDNIRTYVREIR